MAGNWVLWTCARCGRRREGDPGSDPMAFPPGWVVITPPPITDGALTLHFESHLQCTTCAASPLWN